MALLEEAFVFLAAGVIAVPIASRLGLGSVLGYLLAGTLIGPYALGFVHNPEHIMHFAEFGVVMMLFLIGLELQPRLLWRMRKPIVGLGGLQVLITSVVIAGIAMSLGFAWQTGLAIGLILALSSTAIALQILSEKHLMSTEGGKSSFAVLLFQDIAVIPIIAILPLLALHTGDVAHGDGHTNSSLIADFPGWLQTLIVIGVVFGIIVAGHFLMRPIFRFIAESGLREMFTAAALLLVIGIALLMTSVGLSPALGAFIAGVVLAESEFRHELETAINPFKALLLGLFFITVGASIDFQLLGEETLLIVSLVFALVGVKFILLWILGKAFGLHGDERYWFTFALAQGGEFGFVLVSFATQNHVLEPQVVSLLTVTIAISMVLTPILILLNEKLIQPRFHGTVDNAEPEENIDEQHNPVIIAGFGRFGQIVGRLLIANQIPVTVLDRNIALIERVRRFGFKIFYGDASREDLLHTAGAAKAKLLVVAVDDREAINEIVTTAKKHFPHLTLYARAFDVIHFHELEALGVEHIERELFLGSLKMGEMSLKALGMEAENAHQIAATFAYHDEATIRRLGQHEHGSTQYISEAKRAQQEMLTILQADTQNPKAELTPPANKP